MAKSKTQFVCQNCGYISPRYLGRCPNCGEWNTLVEEVVTQTKANTATGLRRTGTSSVQPELLGGKLNLKMNLASRPI